MAIDWSKPIRLKNGDKLELVTTLNDNIYPRVCKRLISGIERETVLAVTEEGQYVIGGDVQVENLPQERVEKFINLYPYGNGGSYYSLSKAEMSCNENLLCTVKLSWNKSDGSDVRVEHATY